MIKELDRIVLTENIPEYGLRQGDIGTVVLEYGQQEGYEVEFVTLTGETIAVTSLFPRQVREIQPREIAHARIVDGLKVT